MSCEGCVGAVKRVLTKMEGCYSVLFSSFIALFLNITIQNFLAVLASIVIYLCYLLVILFFPILNLQNDSLVTIKPCPLPKWFRALPK